MTYNEELDARVAMEAALLTDATILIAHNASTLIYRDNRCIASAETLFDALNYLGITRKNSRREQLLNPSASASAEGSEVYGNDN